MTARYPNPVLSRDYPPRGIGWEVGCEIDFTRLATQSFSDGSNTVAGVTFTAANTANASSFGVTNGTGLVIAPSQNTEFSVTARSAPFVEIKIEDLIGTWAREDRLFFQVAVGAASLGQNGQAYGMQIGQGSRPDDDFVGMYEVIYTGGALTERTSRYRFGTENSLDTGLGSEPDFMALQYRPVMFSSSRAATSALVDGHAWPHPRDMTIAAYGSNIVNGNLDATDDNGTDPTTDLVRLWAERDGTPSAFTATFLGLRILVQRWGS